MSFGGVTRIVIVGGGCSGTLLAAELSAGSGGSPCEVVVIDPGETPGRGVAYGTRCSSHLLNVPAGQMSAYERRPAHFSAWARRRDARVSELSFVPRRLYGDYLESVWQEATRRPARGSSVRHLRSTATSIMSGARGKRLRVGLASGAIIDADHVVLAMGNLPPNTMAPMGIAASAHYIADPWRAGALDGVTGSVLLIGTGLTAVDVALALVDRDIAGPIRAVSRHGLLPRSHRPDAPAVTPLPAAPRERTVRALIAVLRRNAAARGDWRVAIDEFRPHVAAVWRSLPDAERRRFLRHTSRFWEIHRHRMAPEVALRVDRLLTNHRLSVRTGVIASHQDVPDGVEVEVRRRGATDGDVYTVAHVINCTGPQSNIGAAGDPFIDSLLSSRLARPGRYGLGLDAGENGAVIGADGGPSRHLWAIGPLLRGVEWETTAAREIRHQAGQLAAVLLPTGIEAAHGAPEQVMRAEAVSVGALA
jgi:uncharacterized NAD(P)/FAD-binding protein YdhS